MNYIKLHNKFIEHCKITTPIQRLTNRRLTDQRLDNPQELYTEWHHIIPKHDGGTNTKDNYVELLPEEHYLIHLIRYKAYKQRGDFLAVRFIVNGFMNKPYINHGTFLNRLGLHRAMIQRFRQETGWHSKEGVKSISVAQTDMIPCICSVTGMSVGNIHKNDPRYLSGEVIHHSTGMGTYINEIGDKEYMSSDIAKSRGLKSIAKVNKQYAGKNNPMYREMTSEHIDRIYDTIAISITEGHLKKVTLLENLKKEFSEFKNISMVWVLNRFKTMENLVNEYNIARCGNVKYNPYYRYKTQRESARKQRSGYMTEYWENYRKDKNDKN